MTYDLGDKIKLSTVVKTDAGTPVNTPVLVVAVTKPDATVVTPAPTVVNTGAGGVYTAEIPAATVTLAGTWTYVWTATGSVEGTDDGQFDVAAPRALVASLEEFKRHLRQTTDREDDDLRDVLTAVTDLLEPRVGPVQPREFTEWHTLRGGPTLVPRRAPLVSVTSLTRDQGGGVVDATAYIVDTDVDLIRFRSYLRGRYQLVYKAGHQPWPGALKRAALIICQHEWSVRNGTGGRPSPDAEVLVMLPGSGFLVPARALELMRSYLGTGIG